MRSILVAHHPLRGTAALCTLLAAAGCAGSADVRPEPAGDAAGRLADGWGLVMHSAGLDVHLEDPRDAGLLRALRMVDERLLELPAELGGFRPPPGAIEFLCAALSSPWTLQLALDEKHGRSGEDEMPVAVRAQWTVETGSADGASALETRFEGLLALLGLPRTSAEGDPELTEVETPAGSFFYGARVMHGTFVLAWGQPAEESIDLGALDLPRGVTPVFALELEPSELLSPFLGLLEAMPEAAMIRAQFETSGILGPEPLGLVFSAGHGPDRAHYRMRYRNWVSIARRSGALVSAPIPKAELRLVPADATVVSLMRWEPASILQSFEAFGAEFEGAMRAHLREELGLELDADLLEPLGQTTGFYLSDTTGGGGLASAVLFAALDDEVRMTQTLERLAGRVGEHAAELDGRVRVRSFTHEGARCFVLAFPGLPLPIEPALAVASGHLFVAATQQGLFAALEQARGRAPGLDAHAGLRALGMGRLDDLQALQFYDTPRLARDGYGMLGLFSAALANSVRSKTDELRDPGLVLPTYPELLAGARPTLLLSRIQGADLVTMGMGDRSAQLHLAAGLGMSPVLLGMVAVGAFAARGAGIAHGVDHEPGEGMAHHQTMAQVDIWTLASALDQYAIEHDGAYPEALEALLVPDEYGSTYLSSDTLPVDPWGNPYHFEVVDGELRVFSNGADGLPGGEGADRDLDNLHSLFGDDSEGWEHMEWIDESGEGEGEDMDSEDMDSFEFEPMEEPGSEPESDDGG